LKLKTDSCGFCSSKDGKKLFKIGNGNVYWSGKLDYCINKVLINGKESPVYITDGTQVIVTIIKKENLCCIKLDICKYFCEKQCNYKKSLKETLREKIKFIRQKK